jgi:hypothetical protein
MARCAFPHDELGLIAAICFKNEPTSDDGARFGRFQLTGAPHRRMGSVLARRHQK